VVRIHAGEPTNKFNALKAGSRYFVRILYQCVGPARPNSLTSLHERCQHGFQFRIRTGLTLSRVSGLTTVKYVSSRIAHGARDNGAQPRRSIRANREERFFRNSASRWGLGAYKFKGSSATASAARLSSD
jgi:hypothetical protein